MLHPDIQVGLSSIHGRGLVARRIIPINTVVWYLSSDYTKYTHIELLKMPLEIQYLSYWTGDYFIYVHDDSKYMNHSCDPNCWFQGDNMMITRYTIMPGEEVTFDYATSEIDAYFHDDLTCHCHSPLCRGQLRTDDILVPEFQQLYAGHLPSWTVNYIHQFQQQMEKISC